ncbi:MAG: AbrB/MazE/SpoVT family DNA-binding domain-containing protein [Acidobacteriota bacterium]
MASAGISSKGQITIPIEIRRKHGLKPGDRVNFAEGKKAKSFSSRKTDPSSI